MHHQALILNFTDDAEITDAVAPQSGQLTAQRFAEVPRITLSFQARLKPVKDTGCRGTV